MPYRMSGELASKIDCGITTKNLAAGGCVKHWQNTATSSAPKNAPRSHFREILPIKTDRHNHQKPLIPLGILW
jgi:hypothetical protein